jgi:ParB-like chromosome segregation protein Spo0J
VEMINNNTLQNSAQPRGRNDLVVQSLPMDRLRENPGNPRKSKPRQIKQLAKIMGEVSCLAPVIIDETNIILAGHARLKAAFLLGWTHIPIIRVDTLPDTADHRNRAG